MLAITDHWRRTAATSLDGLLVIASSEINVLLPEERDGHLLAFGIAGDPMEFARTRPDFAAGAAWVGEAGRRGVPRAPELDRRVEARPARRASSGIEVYNAGCELEVGRGLSSVHWDDVLETGRLCFGIAADDSHHPGFDSDHAWVWARAPERSQPAVLEALATGRSTARPAR